VNELIITSHPINTGNQAFMNTTSDRTNVNITNNRANMSGVAC